MPNTIDFSLVSSDSFENICSDILSQITGVQMRTFAPGKDHGIDIDTDNCDHRIVAQCKHYEKSGFLLLKKSIIDSVASLKNNNIAPGFYYIFTSLELSEAQAIELFDLSKNFMRDKTYVYDRKKIEAKLDVGTEEGRSIILKNPVLFGKAFMAIFLGKGNTLANYDELFASNVEKYSSLFYPTSTYAQSFSLLKQYHGVMLIGGPGSGKTITATMLASALRIQYPNYSFIYGRNNDSKRIWNTIAKSGKQIIFLDDLLGSTEYDMSTSEASDVTNLLELSHRFPDTYLIINSRQSVFSQCKEKGAVALTNALDNMHLCLVNCDEISEIDKEMIFFNNLRSADIPNDQLKEICLDLGFRKICQSPNYSPRTIENALKKAFISMVEKKKSSYVYEVMYLFDHPNDIWKDEINNRLKPSDRYLLYVMASFGYASILEAELRAAFGEFIKNQPDIDQSKNHFDSSLCKINNEFVKKEVLPYCRRSSYFSFLNPSVYEVVKEEIFGGDNETILDNLRHSIIFFEQYLTLNPDYYKSHDFAEKMKTGAILEMKSAYHQMTYVYFEKLNDGFEKLYANEDVLIRAFVIGIYENSFKVNDKLSVSFVNHLKAMPSSSKFVRMLFSSEDFFRKVINPFEVSTKIEIYKAVLNLAGSQEEKEQFQKREHFSLADTISSLLNDKAYEDMAIGGESLLDDYGVEADDKEKAAETIFSNEWEDEFSDFQRKNPELSFVDSLAVEADPGSHDIVGAIFPDEDEPFDFGDKEGDKDLDKAKELFEDYYKEKTTKEADSGRL